MGLFDIFKKKNTNVEMGENQANLNNNMSPVQNTIPNGVDTNFTEMSKNIQNDVVETEIDEIDKILDQIYPTKKDITVNDSILKRISVYSQNYYWHFVTHGLKDKYQMELTFKLKMNDNINDDKEINCVCEILKLLSRIIEEKNEAFVTSQYIRTNNAISMDADSKSNITGFITIDEPLINDIPILDTKIKLIEIIGATDMELKAIIDNQMTVDDLYKKLGTDITDYNR